MLEVKNLHKNYSSRRGNVTALNDINLSVKQGEFIALRGASGCGKSTLLMILGTMLQPSSGDVILDDCNLFGMSENERNHYRRSELAFVFQMFHLIPYLSAEQNVRLAHTQKDLKESQQILEHLGLGERLRHYPDELSAGERQRCAIARALVNKPKLVLADEPTGNLDPDNAQKVLGDLHNYTQDGGTVILATHGIVEESMIDRTLHMKDGCLVENTEFS